MWQGQNYEITAQSLKIFDFEGYLSPNNKQMWIWTPQRGFPIKRTQPQPVSGEIEEEMKHVLEEVEFIKIAQLVVSDEIAMRLFLENPALANKFEAAKEKEAAIENPDDEELMSVTAIELKGLRFLERNWPCLIASGSSLGGDLLIIDDKGHSVV